MNMFSVNTGKRRLSLILLVILYALGIAFLANGIIVGSAFLGLGIWLTLEMFTEIFPKTRETILTMINPMRLSRRSDSEEFSHLPKRLREIENYMDSIARAEKPAQIQEQEKND
jgi:hypothetical protein